MANSNPNRENLKPWPKGVSGNPGGRPRRKVADVIRDYLGKEIQDGIENLDVFVDIGMKAAMGVKQNRTPDFKFWKEIVDRHDGKIPNGIEEGPDPGEMTTEAIEDELRKLEKGKTP